MNITKEMITAGHKAVMERGEVILSADLLRRIYLSMATVANQEKTLSSPLTDEQVMQAVRHLYQSDVAAGMGFPDDLEVARAVERAHGIGGEA